MGGRLSTDTAAIVAAALLAVYIGVALYGILAPVDRHDPQRGQAVGCLGIVIVTLLAIAILLGFAWHFHWKGVVRGIAALTMFPAASMVLTAVLNALQRAAASLRKD